MNNHRGPPNRFRVAVVTIKIECGTKLNGYEDKEIPDGSDYFTVPLKHGPEYAMSEHGEGFIFVDSGASRCLNRP